MTFLHLRKKLLLCAFLLLAFSVIQAQDNLPVSLHNLTGYKETDRGLTGEATNGHFEITVYSSSVIRVQVNQGGGFDDFSFAVTGDPEDASFTLNETTSQLSLKTDSLELRISREPVRFAFYTLDGRVINEDEPAFGTNWVGEEVTAYKKMQEGERFLGLGEKVGNLDRKGSGYTNYNTDYYAYPLNGDPLYTTFPFYIGVHSGLQYGIYMDNSYKSHFNFGASNNRFSSFTAEDGDMDYFFIYNSSIPQIIKSYTGITGRMPLPPKWSLGYQQCRYSYYPQDEVVSIARTFREKKIPADVIYLDIHYMDNYKIFTWDPENFPEPKRMLDDLKEMGFHTTVIVDPGIKVQEGYEAYEEGVEQDLFLKYPDGEYYTGEVWPGWCHFPDFTKAETRDWWGSKFDGYVDDGIEGFWNDMNEIATWGQRLPEMILFDFEGDTATTRRGRNVYGMEMARATYEGTRELMGKRPFILTRAGFSGVQRYSAVWTGDNVASDDHMLLGVRLVNSLGLSGVPFAGPDVGGFVGNPSPQLFARWLTIGSFTPFFRQHTGLNTSSSEPWTFGEEVEDISRSYIQFRYNLMPYIYSTFYTAGQTGMPVSRSLALNYTHDEKVYDGNYQEQYTFGPSIMVCPVRSDLGVKKVYLPEGEWYDLRTDQRFSGKQEMYVETPIAKLPLFVKAGSIIPMQSPVQNLTEKPEGPLQVHVYKGGQGNSFVYYEDDGSSYNYEDGAFLKRVIRYDGGNQVTFGEAEGSYDSQYSEIKLVLHGFEDINRLRVNNKRTDAGEEGISFFKAVSDFDPQGTADSAEGTRVQVVRFSHAKEQITVSW